MQYSHLIIIGGIGSILPFKTCHNHNLLLKLSLNKPLMICLHLFQNVLELLQGYLV